MSRNIGFAALVATTVGSASLAQALPLTVDPTSGWTLEGALRPSLSPLGLGGHVNWTGFYVGVNGGGVWDDATTADFVGVPIGAGPNPTLGVLLNGSATGGSGGFIGGGQFGYDFQWPFGLVTGVEADLQGATLRSQGSQFTPPLQDAFFPAFTDAGSLNSSKRLDYLGTLRLRVGYQIIPGALTYATGGFAYGHGSLNANTALTRFDVNGNPVVGAAAVTNYDGNRIGFAVGGGVEFSILSNLTAKIEYLYYDLGAGFAQTPFVNTLGNAPNTFADLWAVKATTHFSGNVARVGLNYRFNSDVPSLVAPLVAKY